MMSKVSFQDSVMCVSQPQVIPLDLVAAPARHDNMLLIPCCA